MAPDVERGAIRLWRCESLRIRIDTSVPLEATPEIERRWDELRALNPRHFDGEILGVASFNPDAGLVRARVESYKRLAVQPEVETGVILLAANGAITAHDRHGEEHVLVVRRAEQTRLYAGLWELGPAGGLQSEGGLELDLPGVVAQLQRELLEEAGVRSALMDARCVAWYLDRDAHSLDLLVRARLGESVEKLRATAEARHWDSSDASWVPVSEIGAFVRTHECTPPMGVVLRALAWS